MTTQKTIPLVKGQTLSIGGYRFPVTEDCSITISGKDDSSYYSKEQVEGYGGCMVSSYSIQCPAIIIDESFNRCGYWTGETFCIRTSTEIGGHTVRVGINVGDDEPLKDSKCIAFLHNGFGDGNYTLRFKNGQHIR